MSDLSAAETSLLRATRLLRAASQIEIDLDVATNLPQVLIQDTIRMLVWQAAALLPDGLPLTGAPTAGVGLLVLLEQAERELRSFPIGQYPAGTSHLIVDLCDAIARTRAEVWI